MDCDIPPVIQRLRSFPKNRNRRAQSTNGHQPKLTRALAQRFCDLVSHTDQSLFDLIEQNPDLPHHKTLFNWQQRVPWFAKMWKDARQQQTVFLAQLCLKLAQQACPKTAHVVRVRFDIYKWYMAKYNPELFGDKPNFAPQTTVNVGLSIAPERLNDLRQKLVASRSGFQPLTNGEKQPSTVESVSPARLTNGSETTKRRRAIPDAIPGPVIEQDQQHNSQ